MSNRNIVWQIDLTPLVGKLVTYETKDGSRGNGKLTEVQSISFDLEGFTVDMPVAVVVDADVLLPLAHISRLARSDQAE